MAFEFGNANDDQRKAIITTEGPLLILAGPGTGKTFTLVKRIVYLIVEKGVRPEEIMVATFTEKAAKELITRVTNELLNIGEMVNLNDMYVGTFHSICLRLVKENIDYTQVKKNYRMLDQFDQRYMIYQHINRFRQLPHFDKILDMKTGAWEQAGVIAKYVNNLLEELVDIERMSLSKDPQIKAVAYILLEYEAILHEENYMDFTSIQTNVYRMLKQNPSLLEMLNNRIKYIMIDEYQDTNYIQEQLVLMLAGKRKNICVVGDDDQGLYRFRGASVRNILEFPSHFEKEEFNDPINLMINYRSEKQIIDFYNAWMNDTISFSWKKFRFPKKILPGKQNSDIGPTVIKCSGIEDPIEWGDNICRFINGLKEKGSAWSKNSLSSPSRKCIIGSLIICQPDMMIR